MKQNQQNIAMIVGALIALLVILLSNGRFPAITNPIISNDIDQHRINTAPPILQQGLTIEQDFVARHNGLSSLSVILLKYENVTQNSDSFITVNLLDSSGTLVATQTRLTESLDHNANLRLAFEPIPDSYNQRFTIQATGGENSAFSVWGHNLDVYGEGQFSLSDPSLSTAVQDLRFTTQYHLIPAEISRALGTLLQNDGLVLLLAMLILPLPEP